MPRRIVTVTLSADHRAADGRVASRFLDAFRTFTEQPETP
nr:2-oxo acid dehydrogenase subunit E2 [Mangrovicoccus ximenensis]